jgi:hypothetical protein
MLWGQFFAGVFAAGCKLQQHIRHIGKVLPGPAVYKRRSEFAIAKCYFVTYLNLGMWRHPYRRAVRSSFMMKG